MDALTLDHLGLGPRPSARWGGAAASPGVLYAEDFDEPGLAPGTPQGTPRPPPPAEPEAIQPSFTFAELEAARAEAAASAARLARDELQAETAHGRTQALSRLAAAVAEAKAEARQVAESAAEGVARTMLSLLAGALPALCARHADGEVRAVLRAVLPALQAEPRVTVRLNPHALPGVQAELAGLDPDLAATVALLPTDALPPGDLRVTWAEGALVRDTGAICRAMEGVLAGLGLLAPPSAPGPTPSKKENALVQ